MLAYIVHRSGARLSTRFLNRLRRSAKKIRSIASSRAARAMIHEMTTTPVTGQISNTRPTTYTDPQIVVIKPRLPLGRSPGERPGCYSPR